jgi:hypothetical protein
MTITLHTWHAWAVTAYAGVAILAAILLDRKEIQPDRTGWFLIGLCLLNFGVGALIGRAIP